MSGQALKRLLVTGRTGQVGTELSRLSWSAGIEIVAPARSTLDLADADAVKAYVLTHELAGLQQAVMGPGVESSTIQHRQGTNIACIEEIAYVNGWISREQLIEYGNYYSKTAYGKYLLKLADGGFVVPM
jgi:hypothetical protein